jgi:isopentenyldiphosphate isomerase
MSKHPPIQIVDENDNPIRGASMQEAHEQGLIHEIVLIAVRDPDGRLLLQRRAPGVATNPDTWDFSAAGHVDEGEDYITAALRELHEEIGVEAAPGDLTEKAYYRTENSYDWRKIDRFKKLYEITVAADTEFKLQPEEVTEVKWFTLADLEEEISQHPSEFTFDFEEVLEKLDI